MPKSKLIPGKGVRATESAAPLRAAGYSGTPLPKKLGIQPGSRISLIAAPQGFASFLGTLPEGARLLKGHIAGADVRIWFVRTGAQLSAGIAKRAAETGDRRLWIAWPKKASGIVTDVAEPLVRAKGLAAGLVDYKVCAIDQTWSGLLFTTRRRG